MNGCDGVDFYHLGEALGRAFENAARLAETCLAHNAANRIPELLRRQMSPEAAERLLSSEAAPAVSPARRGSAASWLAAEIEAAAATRFRAQRTGRPSP